MGGQCGELLVLERKKARKKRKRKRKNYDRRASYIGVF
jgi:hypothetical protein